MTIGLPDDTSQQDRTCIVNGLHLSICLYVYTYTYVCMYDCIVVPGGGGQRVLQEAGLQVHYTGLDTWNRDLVYIIPWV